jgi:hypothetical protein
MHGTTGTFSANLTPFSLQAFDDAHTCFKINRENSKGDEQEDNEVIARQIEALKCVPVCRERCASLLDDMATNLVLEFEPVAEEVQRWCSSEKDAELAQKLGQLQPFLAVSPPECADQLASFGPT